jgi:ABC-type multidrug transport system fused ATPase/permease subunit
MYKRELQQTARKSLFLKLLHLPYGILIPILISTEVTNALAGRTKSVLTTAAGILAIVFCYTYFYGRLEIAFRKEKEQAVQACKMKQYRTIFSDSFEKLYHSGLGKNLENMKDDFNAVTELMTEHRPMFAASLAEAVLFGGYLCWKNPLVGICLILISLLQVIPPLLVKKYIQVNYDFQQYIIFKILVSAPVSRTATFLSLYRDFPIRKLNHTFFMRNINHRLIEISNKIHQPLFCRLVQVVRRLVQNQHLCIS